MIQLIPAYERDYKNPKAVRDDWLAGRNFIVADTSSPRDGEPVNQLDIPEDTLVQVRYSKQRKKTTFYN